jgi:cell division initiation protein
MRLNHLDILEQCFRDKFRGYNKEEVDTFLHLISDDFKNMTEEIENLRVQVAELDQAIEDLKSNDNDGSTSPFRFDPEQLKEKARQIIQSAREQAEQHKSKAMQELNMVKSEVDKLRQEKSKLIDNIKETVRDHLQQFKK